jgi:hypothetical protein
VLYVRLAPSPGQCFVIAGAVAQGIDKTFVREDCVEAHAVRAGGPIPASSIRSRPGPLALAGTVRCAAAATSLCRCHIRPLRLHSLRRAR